MVVALLLVTPPRQAPHPPQCSVCFRHASPQEETFLGYLVGVAFLAFSPCLVLKASTRPRPPSLSVASSSCPRRAARTEARRSRSPLARRRPYSSPPQTTSSAPTTPPACSSPSPRPTAQRSSARCSSLSLPELHDASQAAALTTARPRRRSVVVFTDTGPHDHHARHSQVVGGATAAAAVLSGRHSSGLRASVLLRETVSNGSHPDCGPSSSRERLRMKADSSPRPFSGSSRRVSTDEAGGPPSDQQQQRTHSPAFARTQSGRSGESS